MDMLLFVDVKNDCKVHVFHEFNVHSNTDSVLVVDSLNEWSMLKSDESEYTNVHHLLHVIWFKH